MKGVKAILILSPTVPIRLSQLGAVHALQGSAHIVQTVGQWRRQTTAQTRPRINAQLSTALPWCNGCTLCQLLDFCVSWIFAKALPEA